MDPRDMKVKRGSPAPLRFAQYVAKDGPNGCWLWTGRRDRLGYGRFGLGARTEGMVLSHRYAYELLVGPIPEGHVLDHLCRTPSCVNPSHLEPVTQHENLLRGRGWSGVNAARTHCPHGHPYEGGNLIIDKRGFRGCRECRRRQDRERAPRQRVKHRVS